MPNKLTDSEIKDLLERKAKVGCKLCTFNKGGHCKVCNYQVMRSALDLFNRLQAENKRLNNLKRFEKFISERIHTDKERNLTWDFATKEAEQEAFEEELEKLFDIAIARAEAYTDFAELLKSKLNHPYIQKQGIDFVNFLKAMVEDSKKEMVGDTE